MLRPQMEQNDRLIQGMAGQGNFRIIAAQTTQTVEVVRLRIDASPIATDALGRAMTAAVILARLLEKSVRNQRVTLRFEGGGPLGLVIAEGGVDGSVRGYVNDPQFGGPLDVGEAIGFDGVLTVIRGTPPLGKPYTSQVELVSGEIAKDVAQYLSASEQVASAVLLGVLNRPSGVAAAGGMIVQAFPHATDQQISLMEQRIRESPSFSSLLAKMPIEAAVAEVLHGLDYKPIDASFNVPIRFHCSCNRERALAPLTLLDPEELLEMADKEGGSQVTCQYCAARYGFSREDLRMLTAPPDA
jgi:molecular chaperone Hsp33